MAAVLGCSYPIWRDEREYSPKGVIDGYVINKVTEEAYGLQKDGDFQIRAKALAVAGVSAPVGLLLSAVGTISMSMGLLISLLSIARIATRIIDIMYGDFWITAYDEARKKWLQHRFKWRQEGGVEPTQRLLKLMICREALTEFTKSVFKAITIPIQMWALCAAGLFSQLSPLTGRWMISGIEQFWGRDLKFEPITIDFGLYESKEETFRKDMLEMRIACHNSWYTYSETIAPCMLPKSVWNRRNLYAATDPYATQETIRSRLRSLINKIEGNVLFWNGILKKDAKGMCAKLSDVFRKYHSLRIDNVGEYHFIHRNLQFGKMLSQIRLKLAEMGNILQFIEQQYEGRTFAKEEIEKKLAVFSKMLEEIPGEISSL